MANKKRRMRDKPSVAQPGVEPPDNVVELRPTKDGLLVPDGPEPEGEKDCRHEEAAKRYTLEELGDMPMICGDCEEDVMVHTMNFVVLSPEKLDDLKMQMQQIAEFQAKLEKRKKLGLVLPGDPQPPTQGQVG